MSLKQQIQTWSDALDAYEAQDFEGCIELFDTIADESKILFNMGLVHATIGSHEQAVEHFGTAVAMDRYLAVAYFQSGVSNFLLGRYPEARRDFDDTYIYLRENTTIDYEQLGLKFRLYSCEVLFNRGLSSIYMGQMDEGLADLRVAATEKQTEEHGVIDEALGDRGEGYTVFSIPVGVLYRPSANKLKNLKTKNYLGAATVIAATDSNDAFTGFTGSTLARNATLLRSAAVFGADGKGAGSDAQDRNPGLARSKTTAPRLERPIRDDITPTPLRRNNTAAPAAPTRGPALGLGLNRSNTLPDKPGGGGRGEREQPFRNGAGLPTPPGSDELAVLRTAEFPPSQRDTTYSGALDAYYDETPPPPIPTLPLMNMNQGPEGQPRERVEKWARQQNYGGLPTGQSLSRNPSASDNGAKKPLMRSNTMGGGRLIVEQDDFGPTTGISREDAYEGTVVAEREMSKVRIKLRYRGDTRGMSISPDMGLEDFIERVRRKFESESDLPMQYKDVDGTLVSLIDSDDWESAIDEARENARGKSEGKLEIFIAEN